MCVCVCVCVCVREFAHTQLDKMLKGKEEGGLKFETQIQTFRQDVKTDLNSRISKAMFDENSKT